MGAVGAAAAAAGAAAAALTLVFIIRLPLLQISFAACALHASLHRQLMLIPVLILIPPLMLMLIFLLTNIPPLRRQMRELLEADSRLELIEVKPPTPDGDGGAGTRTQPAGRRIFDRHNS